MLIRTNRKVFVVLLLTIMVFVLAACQSGQPAESSNSKTEKTASDQAIPEATAVPYTNPDFFKFIVNVDGGAEITGYTGNEAAVIIPSELGGHPVVAIQENAFEGSTLIGRVILPDTVTTIGDYAFSKCTKLKEVYLPDSLTLIGESAFAGDTSLQEIKLPHGEYTMMFGVFADTGLTSIEIPKGATHEFITEYNPKANWFQGCTLLRTVVFEEGTTCVCMSDFTGNFQKNNVLSISSMTIPASVTKIVPVNDMSSVFNARIDKIVTPEGSFAFKYFTEGKSDPQFVDRRDFSTWEDTFSPFSGDIVTE